MNEEAKFMSHQKTKNWGNKVKLIRQNYGSGIALGVEGDRQEVERFSNLFYNWKGTQSDPIWMSDTFAYLLTDEPRFFKAYTGMFTSSLAERVGNEYRGKSGGVFKRAVARAKVKFDKIPEEKFLPDIVAEAITWE